MSAWARPGVKCVSICEKGWSDIRRSLAEQGPDDGGPMKGEIVTVRSVAIGPDGDTYIDLMERDEGEFFWVERFRPLITRTQEQDVALFRQIIAHAPAGVDA